MVPTPLINKHVGIVQQIPRQKNVFDLPPSQQQINVPRLYDHIIITIQKVLDVITGAPNGMATAANDVNSTQELRTCHPRMRTAAAPGGTLPFTVPTFENDVLWLWRKRSFNGSVQASGVSVDQWENHSLFPLHREWNDNWYGCTSLPFILIRRIS